MKHVATPRFWNCYHELPEEARLVADRAHLLIRQDARHPSLQFKRIGRLWSVRVGLHHRALAVEDQAVLVWFWIGSHAEYDRFIAAKK